MGNLEERKIPSALKENDQMTKHTQDNPAKNPTALGSADSAKAAELVHPIVLLALEQSGVPVRRTLRASYADKEMIQTVEAPGGTEITLYWYNGVLTGVFTLALGVTFQDGCVVINANKGAVPASLVGSSLDQCIRIPGLDLSIFQITQVDAPIRGRQHLHISAQLVLFDSDGNLLQVKEASISAVRQGRTMIDPAAKTRHFAT